MWQITYPMTRLVSRHRGTLPVILTCPHDGDETPAGVPESSGQGTPSRCNFKKSGDRQTRTTTTGIAERLLEIVGEAPYVVIAEFLRKYIDANRRYADVHTLAAFHSINLDFETFIRHRQNWGPYVSL